MLSPVLDAVAEAIEQPLASVFPLVSVINSDNNKWLWNDISILSPVLSVVTGVSIQPAASTFESSFLNFNSSTGTTYSEWVLWRCWNHCTASNFKLFHLFSIPDLSTKPFSISIYWRYLCNGLRFLGVLRGHVTGVYQIAWSADSRLLVSGSKDSTLKGEWEGAAGLT